MNHTARHDVFADTQPAHEVTVSCDDCGEPFTTDEDTAYEADRQGTDLHCSQCEGGHRQAPPQTALEDPTVNAVHDDLRTEAGPNAEPPLEATFRTSIGFGELAQQNHVDMEFTRGTETLGTTTVKIGEAEGLHLPVDIEFLPALSDEAVDAIVSTLSRHTQLLIDLQGA